MPLTLRLSHRVFRAILNVCIPYTSRSELTNAVQLARANLASTIPATMPLDADTLAEHVASQLQTSGCPKLDLLVRTSGEHRLSDFLMWQCAADGARLLFVPQAWPELSFWTLAPAIMDWQVAQLAKVRRLKKEITHFIACAPTRAF